jgi:hypothetical protein
MHVLEAAGAPAHRECSWGDNGDDWPCAQDGIFACPGAAVRDRYLALFPELPAHRRPGSARPAGKRRPEPRSRSSWLKYESCHTARCWKLPGSRLSSGAEAATLYPDAVSTRDVPQRRAIHPDDLRRLEHAAGLVFAREPEVLVVYLYGSAARGEPARDLDVAVLFRRAHHHPVAWRSSQASYSGWVRPAARRSICVF